MTGLTINDKDYILADFMAMNLCLDDKDREVIRLLRKVGVQGYDTGDTYEVEVSFSVGSDDEYYCTLQSGGRGDTLDFWRFENQDEQGFSDEDHLPTAPHLTFGDLLGVFFFVGGSALYELRHERA